MINSFTGMHAGHYDLVYASKPYDAEASFVLTRLEGVLGRRPRRLLDLACGTGRHAAAFASQGIDVTGVDLNGELIERARENAPDAEFAVQDMTELDLGDERFDAVTCLFDSIGYPLENEGVIAALAAARRHMTPSGALALEFLHGPAMLRNASSMRVRRWQAADGDLVRISETQLDVKRSLMEVDYELFKLRPDGTYARWREHQSNRYFSIPEMGALLTSAGLALEEAVAAYRANPEVDAETFHVLATARPAPPR